MMQNCVQCEGSFIWLYIVSTYLYIHIQLPLDDVELWTVCRQLYLALGGKHLFVHKQSTKT